MTVRRLETEMPASEISEWVAHWKLSHAEAERARERAENKQKLKHGR
jgi:hypothetical protein